MTEFTSTKAMGSDGYLAERGLIPLSTAERNEYVKAATSLKPMN